MSTKRYVCPSCEFEGVEPGNCPDCDMALEEVCSRCGNSKSECVCDVEEEKGKEKE